MTDSSNQKRLIEAQSITVRFGGIGGADEPVLDQVSLEIAAGEIVSLIGPNGSGKTTLVRALLGLAPITSGTIVRRPGLRLGYVPQRFALDPTLPITVERFLKLGRPVSATRLNQALEASGAGALLRQPVQQVSGGEFQRVLLARALARAPDLLVLDEPAQGVDVTGQAELFDLIAGLRDDLGCGVLLVSHDLHLVMAATDRVICLNHHVCCTGHPESVSADPAYLELFGARAKDALAIYTHHHDHTHTPDGHVVGPVADPSSETNHEHDHG